MEWLLLLIPVGFLAVMVPVGIWISKDGMYD